MSVFAILTEIILFFPITWQSAIYFHKSGEKAYILAAESSKTEQLTRNYLDKEEKNIQNMDCNFKYWIHKNPPKILNILFNPN